MVRMLVVDGQKVRGHLKETHLPLEGFFEALTRVAVLKALPTQAEIDSGYVDDCADFFLEVLEPYPDVYEHLKWHERRGGCGHTGRRSD